MAWVLLISAVVCAVEVALRLPLASLLDRFLPTLASISHVLMSKKISDHWKEKALLAYSKTLLILSLRFAFCLLWILAPLIVMAVFGMMLGSPVADLLISTNGIVVSLVFALVYIRVRKRLGH